MCFNCKLATLLVDFIFRLWSTKQRESKAFHEEVRIFIKTGIKDIDKHCSSQTIMQTQGKNLIKPHCSTGKDFCRLLDND